MKLFIVLKAPHGIHGAYSVVGAFTMRVMADAACTGAGSFLIAEVDADKAYREGELMSTRSKVILPPFKKP